MNYTEADICRIYVLPKLKQSNWLDENIKEQKSITDWKILIENWKYKWRWPQLKPDYLLYYQNNLCLAVVEAKKESKSALQWMEQSKNYAKMLWLYFAYSTNWKEIEEYDFSTWIQRTISDFPTRDELWERYKKIEWIVESSQENQTLTPYYKEKGSNEPRYYQEIAINKVVNAINRWQKRILLVMATWTWKTYTSFQMIYRLWKARTCKRILFLADRNILVDQAKDKDFIPFWDARYKITSSWEKVKSREMYFAIYQGLSDREWMSNWAYRDYPKDYFDLIVIDECHRWSAKAESSWREILNHFDNAIHVGLTATPKSDNNVNTFAYFWDPVYTYSLKQWIEDGFLAPYSVRRIHTNIDIDWFRPQKWQTDKDWNLIDDEEYSTKDWYKKIKIEEWNLAIAEYITEYLKQNNARYDKTLVFCINQEHALDIQKALSNQNKDIVKEHPDYCVRITSDEWDIWRTHLSNFTDLESKYPCIVTSSQMLTTWVDTKLVKHIILCRPIENMIEFKQIIWRWTRVQEDMGKTNFTILDFTKATKLFADKDFDWEAISVIEKDIKEKQESKKEKNNQNDKEKDFNWDFDDDEETKKIKLFVVNWVNVFIANESVKTYDVNGKEMTMSFTDYTKNQVRTIFNSKSEFIEKYKNHIFRNEILEELEKRWIKKDILEDITNKKDSDLFDILVHIAFDSPLLTRKEKANKIKKEKMDYFDFYWPEAKEIIWVLIDKYAESWLDDYFSDTKSFLDSYNFKRIKKTPMQIIQSFWWKEKMDEVVNKIEELTFEVV